MSKEKKFDTSNTEVSENKEEDFSKYIENQFTQKNKPASSNEEKTEPIHPKENTKKQYFA